MKYLKEKGMLIVNMLFFVSTFFPRSNIIFGCAVTLWVVVLILFIKESKSNFLRFFYLLLIICIICIVFMMWRLASGK